MLGSAVAEVCIHILSQRDGRRQNSCGVSVNHELWVCGEPGGLLAKFDGVLTFSHFLPRIDLLSEQAHLRIKGLPKMAGSPGLGPVVAGIGGEMHVFGHSNIPWDETIDGVALSAASVGLSAGTARPGKYPRANRQRDYS